ncbi:branched-chain amino acid transporter [Chromobacterium violaceum]|uniref:AzlD domain-containing protein n=1 Tax=Chromobacterium violaceum TaxID=536 RepID=UPI000C1272B7|nr:AzlD domain-containing protein [Chromobacterium violaceum]ATP30530.1 branched-chain amino acid transporter [Chromobacterium violaceum]ATP34439.1 branched-chain amino acid transporter [Chromobacterium violaceum]
MNGWQHWAAIAGMLAATLAVRASFLIFGQRLAFPGWLNRALHYVPAAVLSALVVPMALAPAGAIDLSWHNAYLVGTIVAIAVAWKNGKTLLAIVVSFAVYGALRWLL